MTWLIHSDWKSFPSFTAKQETCQRFIAASLSSTKLSPPSSLNVSGGCLEEKKTTRDKLSSISLPSHPPPFPPHLPARTTSLQFWHWWLVRGRGPPLADVWFLSKLLKWTGYGIGYMVEGVGGLTSWKCQGMRTNWDSFNLACFLHVCDLRLFKSPITHQRDGPPLSSGSH